MRLQTLGEIERLAPRNVFVALTSIDNNNPRIVGGFRFSGSPEEAERIIGKWRSMLTGQNSSLKQEKVQYQGHKMAVDKTGSLTIATAFDFPWFFMATDASDMQSLLDRAIAVHQIQTTGWTRMRDTVQPFRAGPPTTWHSFICSQRHFRNDSRRCALLSGQPRLPAKARCSRKCAASPAQCDSRTEKCTTCFSWACQSWNTTRRSAARRYLSGRRRHSFTSRCYLTSGKEWTLSTRRRPLQGRRCFRRLAIVG